MPGEPSTRRGRASRERIVERAADLFAERGIAATSVDEVLAAAKAGKGQFYHYFRSRDELAAAAVGSRPDPAGAAASLRLRGGRTHPGVPGSGWRVGKDRYQSVISECTVVPGNRPDLTITPPGRAA